MITNCERCGDEIEDDEVEKCEVCGQDGLCNDCLMDHRCVENENNKGKNE